MNIAYILAAALDYVNRGWPVLPLNWPVGAGCSCGEDCGKSAAKHPLTAHGLKDATTDQEQVKVWWKRWPLANIGILTGQESGLLVLDIDPRNGGTESFKRLPGNLPLTPTAYSGGGGEHYYLKHPGDRYIKSATELGGYPGIDLKADGGYIVAPPSRHISGGIYSWKISPEGLRHATGTSS